MSMAKNVWQRGRREDKEIIVYKMTGIGAIAV
jgi:hypothetical protein